VEIIIILIIQLEYIGITKEIFVLSPFLMWITKQLGIGIMMILYL